MDIILIYVFIIAIFAGIVLVNFWIFRRTKRVVKDNLYTNQDTDLPDEAILLTPTLHDKNMKSWQGKPTTRDEASRGVNLKDIEFEKNVVFESTTPTLELGGMVPNMEQLQAKDDLYIQQIETGGGASILGATTISEGDFVGRDQVIQGDYVQGDKIIHEASKLRLPLQRPARTDHFVNRKDDLIRLIRDLQPGRVITLCGPGGIGKSALAAEAIWQLAPGVGRPSLFPDGILFYSFYNQPQAALALEHIARSFGEEIRPSPREAAQRALAGRRALLILDGTEQADDLHSVVDIRDQCGVLVTSRVRKDEVDKRQDLAPLPLEDAVILLQALGGRRASDTVATHRIAELVGGLPLALRLVGRYLAQNEENVNEYLMWLADTPLTALDQGQRREQSVPVLLARSLDQISEQARLVLGVIGLLALAPFTCDPIVAALTISMLDARRALGELINYGLLLRPSELYQVTHALIHTYARLQLVPSVEVVERLVVHHIALIKEHRSEFQVLNSLQPHLLALLTIGREQATWAKVSDLVWAIEGYFDFQGYWTERIIALEAGLTAARELQNHWNEESCLGNLGSTYLNLGQIEQAIIYYEQAITIAQELGDRRNEGIWVGNLGSAYLELGYTEKAIKFYEQALTIAQNIGNRRDEGNWLGKFGIAHHILGHAEKAIEFYEQALAIARDIGDRWNEGNHITNLGTMHRELGQLEKAVEFHNQALAIAREIGHRQGESNNLEGLGISYYTLGQLEQAISYYELALAIVRHIGLQYNEEVLLSNLGNACHNLGQMEQAISYYKSALTIAKATGNRPGEGNHLKNLGLTYAASGQLNKARQSWEEALRVFEELDLPNVQIIHQGLSSLQNDLPNRPLSE